MKTNSFLIIASDYKPQPGGRADYIDNLARGLISIGNRAKVLAVVQQHKKDRLAFLENYEEWVIPFPVVYDQRPKNWLGNKFVSLFEITRCVSPRSRRLLAKTSLFRASNNSVARLEQVLAGESPDVVVFGHLDMRLYPLALCLRERGIPYGIIVHGCDTPRFPNRKNDLIRKESVLHGAKWIAANSRYTKSEFAEWGIPTSRVRIVHPPIAEEAIRRSADFDPSDRDGDKLKLVSFSRVVKGKGIDIALRALKILTAKGVPYQYVIGGDGSERASLEALAVELGLMNSVRFVGSVPDDEKWRLLRDSGVYVMPSRAEEMWVEGFGIAFIEAAAFGLPAVATKVGGIPDAVLDGKTGILVPPESPEDVAEALIFLYRNPEVRKQMGAAAMERARSQFSPATVAAHFQEEISNVA